MFEKVRTRFAPSPTGYMHIGNLRTALYAYLLAKKNGGDFVLRIEDTDVERKVFGAEDLIYKTLKIAGLIWDEGPDIGGSFGPYIQSSRIDIFKSYALKLIESKKAYYCFCTKERLEKIKAVQKAAKKAPKYDGHCYSLSKQEIEKNLRDGKSYVIRQKMPTIGVTDFHDEVFGRVSVKNSELEDQILLKSDGMPTYNFANVVDDHLMRISHVVRGNEYLSSTPKYNLLYEAFGWDIPKYIHCAPVMKNAKQKLSKRNGDETFDDLLNMGYLPKAILNYIALLGWSPKTEQEIFSLGELIDSFDLSGISKSPAIFDIKKLRSINSIYIKNMPEEEFLENIRPYIEKKIKRKLNYSYLVKVLKNRTENFKDVVSELDFLDELPEYDIDLFENKKMKSTKETSLQALKNIEDLFKNIEQDLTEKDIHSLVFSVIEKMNVKNGVVLWPLRVALSGKQFTPGGAIEIFVLLGKNEAISRIKKAIKSLC